MSAPRLAAIILVAFVAGCVAAICAPRSPELVHPQLKVDK